MAENANDRLDSWKEIATFLNRNVRTVQRWERENGLPVYRVPGKSQSVYAYRSEIDAWLSDTISHQEQEKDRPLFQASFLENQLIQNVQPGPQNRAFTHNPLPSEFATRAPAHGRQLRLPTLGIAGLAVLAIALLSALIFMRTKAPRAADSSSGVTFAPPGLEHRLQVSLVNGQPEAVRGPFQQLLVVDSSRYASFEAENLQNVEFFDAHGKILRSWLESGNSNSSTRTAYWIQLPDGMPAGKVVDVYIGFAPIDRNLFNPVTTGEAPGLSPAYGEYDNGGYLFPHYANFAGKSLPPGWYSGLTPGGQGEIRVNNGVFIAHSGRGGGTAFLGSDWVLGYNVAEMDLLTEQTVQGQDMIMVCSASPTSFRWTPNSVGYQDMSALEIEDNNSGKPSVLAVAMPNPRQSLIIGMQGGSLFADYQLVANVHPRICGGNYLASSVNSGFNASFSFDWVRLRLPPPHGVMPAPIFGELK